MNNSLAVFQGALNMEMISHFALPVWLPLRTLHPCWLLGLDTAVQVRRVKETESRWTPSKLWAARKLWRRSAGTSSSWAVVSQLRPSVTWRTRARGLPRAPRRSVLRRTGMKPRRWTVWQRAAWGWQSLRTALIGPATRHRGGLTAWKGSSPSRGVTVTWPVWAWPFQSQMVRWLSAAGPVQPTEAPCLKTGRATPTPPDMTVLTARRSPVTGWRTQIPQA